MAVPSTVSCQRRATLAALVLVIGAAGVLASSPATAQQVARTGDYLKLMDKNGDGKVQLSEYLDWLSYGFDQMDRNKDGVLTPDEQPGGKGPIVTRAAHRQRLADQFRKLDRNKDGVLDAKELASPPR